MRPSRSVSRDPHGLINERPGGQLRSHLVSSPVGESQPVLLAAPRPVRPFIKWAGGKSRLLSSLLPHVPLQFRRYHEPFLGGGAMLFAVAGRAELPAIATDLNEELVNAWQVVRDAPDRLCDRLLGYAARDSEQFYYEVRGLRFEVAVDRAAHFLYLNRTAWNGLYRVNRWGEFNVPWGARRFSPLAQDTLSGVAASLADTTIEAVDFRASLERPEGGDFVYLDPPYLKVSDTSKFNGYTQRRFRAADLADLAGILRELTDRGVRWLLSNRDSEAIRELFEGHEIIRLTVRRSVAAQNRRAVEPANSPEVIVSNRLVLN